MPWYASPLTVLAAVQQDQMPSGEEMPWYVTLLIFLAVLGLSLLYRIHQLLRVVARPETKIA